MAAETYNEIVAALESDPDIDEASVELRCRIIIVSL